MAANTDKLKKVARRFSTTLSSGITDSDTTIPLTSATGLPTDTAITISIDRLDANGVKTIAKEELVTGVISGLNLTNCVREVAGTAQAHASGAVVEIMWVASLWNDVVDWGLVEHNQDGTHGNVTGVTKTTTKASAYPSGSQSNLTDDTDVLVVLDAELYDIGSDFTNTVTYKFTAPVTGYYLLSSSITYGGSDMVADKEYRMIVAKNGTPTTGTVIIENRMQSSLVAPLTISSSKTIYLTASDYLQLYAHVKVGANTQDIVSGTKYTYMSVHLLSV